jgi:hypothetical protein
MQADNTRRNIHAYEQTADRQRDRHLQTGGRYTQSRHKQKDKYTDQTDTDSQTHIRRHEKCVHNTQLYRACVACTRTAGQRVSVLVGMCVLGGQRNLAQSMGEAANDLPSLISLARVRELAGPNPTADLSLCCRFSLSLSFSLSSLLSVSLSLCSSYLFFFALCL